MANFAFELRRFIATLARSETQVLRLYGIWGSIKNLAGTLFWLPTQPLYRVIQTFLNSGQKKLPPPTGDAGITPGMAPVETQYLRLEIRAVGLRLRVAGFSFARFEWLQNG